MTQEKLARKLGYASSHAVHNWLKKNKIPPKEIQAKLVRLCSCSAVEIIALGKCLSESILVDEEFIDKTNSLSLNNLDGEVLFNEAGNWFLETTGFFPKISYTNASLRFLRKKDEVIIFYENKLGASPRPLLLPSRIRVSQDFLRWLGIYIGEGTKTRRHVKVTNSEPEIIKQALKFFKEMGVAPDYVWVQLHECSEKTFDEVKNFWLNSCGLRVQKVFVKKAVGSSEHKIKEYGTLHVEFYGKILRLFVDGLLVDRNLFLKKEFAKPLLQGLFAAEGSKTMRGKRVSAVNYTSTKNEELEYVKQLLCLYEVQSAIYFKQNLVSVCGFENMEKLMRLDVFVLRPKDKTIFDTSMLHFTKHMPVVNKKKIIAFLSKKPHSTTREVSDALNLSYDNAKKHLRELFKAGLVEKLAECNGYNRVWLPSIQPSSSAPC
ncbi:MAG: LAGLIDADG family homing endonuclease [Candidatus Micrarchaeota archaeon]